MFNVNGKEWNIQFVNPFDDVLKRSDGSYTVGVTNYLTSTIYLENTLHGEFLKKVITHEVVHVYCMSFNIFMDIETEEVVADFIATFGRDIIRISDYVFDLIRKIS